MPTILALDSTAEACSVALLHNGDCTQQLSSTAREHTRHLLPMVDSLLAEHGLTLANLDAIAFGRGPGSFTGLRICMGIVQGLAFGADLPVLPISSLKAMALGAADVLSLPDGYHILPALDARMGEVYWGEYRLDSGLPVQLAEEKVGAPESVVAYCQPSAEPLARLGVGAGWHYPAMQHIDLKKIDLSVAPQAMYIAALAEKDWYQGLAVDVFDAELVYLRNSVAWKKRERIRGQN